MRTSKPILSLLFFVLILMNVHVVFAEDWRDIPNNLADQYLGGNVFAAQILCSLVVLFICLLPMLIVALKSPDAAIILSLFLGGVTLCALTAIGWLAPFILVFCMFGEIVFIVFALGKAFGSHGGS
jgi:hypothetical protein